MIFSNVTLEVGINNEGKRILEITSKRAEEHITLDDSISEKLLFVPDDKLNRSLSFDMNTDGIKLINDKSDKLFLVLDSLGQKSFKKSGYTLIAEQSKDKVIHKFTQVVPSNIKGRTWQVNVLEVEANCLLKIHHTNGLILYVIVNDKKEVQILPTRAAIKYIEENNIKMDIKDKYLSI